MKYSLWVAGFFRCVALVLVVTVTTVSCSFSFGPAPVPEGGGVGWIPFPTITPSEGNVRYVYLDDEGNPIDEDKDIGITGFFIENNARAAGTVIISLDTGIDGVDKIVVVKNEKDKIEVSMCFEDGEAFPYQMIATQGQDTYYSFPGPYSDTYFTYTIDFEQDGFEDGYSHREYYLGTPLNPNIFSLYQDDPALNASQNIRIKNVTAALGFWGSLAVSFSRKESRGPNPWERGFSSTFKGVAKIFTAVSVVATVVAYVAAPFGTFISPGAEMAIQKADNTADITSEAAAAAFVSFVVPYTEQFIPPPPFTETPFITVTNINEDRPLENGEEFHIGLGSDMVFNFSWPGLDNTTIGPIDDMHTANSQMVNRGSNKIFFVVSLEKDPDRGTDAYQVRIKRKPGGGHFIDGKVAFGFYGFTDTTLINGSSEGLRFKLPWDREETAHTGLVVIRFCINPFCPDYVK